jgi:hypothetical protein
MLESKDHWQNFDSCGALDLTFATRQFCGEARRASLSDFANASPSLASASGENDGSAITAAAEKATIAKAAKALIIVDLLTG